METIEIAKVNITDEIRNIIKTEHYIGTVPLLNTVYVLFQNDNNNVKNIIGIAMFGNGPVCHNNGKLLFDYDIKIMELTRLWISKNNHNSNIASKFLSMVFNDIKFRNGGQPVAILSYADNMQNHYGIVYQASNFDYIGEMLSADIFIDKYSNKQVNGRTVSKLVKQGKKSRNEFIRVKNTYVKYKYIYIIATSKQKANINKHHRLYDILPYPKPNNNN